MIEAENVAYYSPDSTKVGAVLIRDDMTILSAFNTFPDGISASTERLERPLKYNYINHAEANLIGNAARYGIPTIGCSVEITHMPCIACARLLIQAGIKSITVGKGKLSVDTIYNEEQKIAEQLFIEAGVTLIKHPAT